MAYKGWRTLKNSKPPVNQLVNLQHAISGIGAPEREGWYSTGRMRETGAFSINQNNNKTVDFRQPTHWKMISKQDIERRAKELYPDFGNDNLTGLGRYTLSNNRQREAYIHFELERIAAEAENIVDELCTIPEEVVKEMTQGEKDVQAFIKSKIGEDIFVVDKKICYTLRQEELAKWLYEYGQITYSNGFDDGSDNI